MKTIYLLESVNIENKSGVLKVKKDEVGARFKTINVSISPLLANRIAQATNKGLNEGETFIGTEFSSTLNSDKFADNPFKLIQFKPENGSDMPANFRLEFVFELRGIKTDIIDVFNRKVSVWKNRTLRPKQYLRYIEVKVSKMIAECGLGINIVQQ